MPVKPGPEVVKLFSCSAQLSLKFILLIIIIMPIIVGILTFMSTINYQFLRFEPEFSTNFDYFSIYEQLKFRAQLRLCNLGAWTVYQRHAHGLSCLKKLLKSSVKTRFQTQRS